MIRLLSLCFWVFSCSPSPPSFVEDTKVEDTVEEEVVIVSQWERRHRFLWDRLLLTEVVRNYGDSSKFFPRLAQLYAESAFDSMAISDFGGWRKAGMNEVAALLERKAAGGLAQFIWPTAQRYGATEVWTLFSPAWSIPAQCRYMLDIVKTLSRTSDGDARRMLFLDGTFQELVATASYNTGENRMLNRLNRYGYDWATIRISILDEPRQYAEKIISTSDKMKNEERWKPNR